MTAFDKRIVVTGMSVITTLGDDLGSFYDNLIAGKSGITRWRFFDDDKVYSKIGGDLSNYDFESKLDALSLRLPEELSNRLRRLCRRSPFATKLSMLCAADAWLHSGLNTKCDTTRRSVLVGGHNLNERYFVDNMTTFIEEHDYIDPGSAFQTLDTDHAACVSELLGWNGPIYTVGGACASASIAIHNAINEILCSDQEVVMVVGAALDFSALGIHAMAMIDAISIESFNDEPGAASRPYDVRREGFVPAHGTAALVIEEHEHACARHAKIFAEVLGCEVMSDANRLPNPSLEGQVRTLSRLFARSGVAPDEVDFVSAHATSTRLGDLSEINAIKTVFGEAAKRIKINAPKSMLGHTCWSAPAVESVAALLQMERNKLHPSINIEEIDPEVDLDVCADGPVDCDVNVVLKNAFGFGGINCCTLFRRYAA